MKKSRFFALAPDIARFLLLPMALFVFSSCQKPTKSLRFSVLPTDPFTCRVEGEVNGKAFSARFDADGAMTYDTPNAFSGITVSPVSPRTQEAAAPSDGSDTILRIDTLSLPGDCLPGLSVPFLLLFGEYEVTGNGSALPDGQSACFVCGINRHGDRKIWLSSDGTPLRVCGTYDGISADFTLSDWTPLPTG